jgi:hypothetical protein
MNTRGLSSILGRQTNPLTSANLIGHFLQDACDRFGLKIFAYRQVKRSRNYFHKGPMLLE